MLSLRFTYQQTAKSRIGFSEQLDLRLHKAWELESWGGLLNLPTFGTLTGESPSTLIKSSLLLSLEATQLHQGNSVKKVGRKRDIMAFIIDVKS